MTELQHYLNDMMGPTRTLASLEADENYGYRATVNELSGGSSTVVGNKEIVEGFESLFQGALIKFAGYSKLVYEGSSCHDLSFEVLQPGSADIDLFVQIRAMELPDYVQIYEIINGERYNP